MSTWNSKRDGYPTSSYDRNNVGPRVTVTPYAEAIAAISSGSACQHTVATNQDANEYVKTVQTGRYSFKETERGTRECYIITEPTLKFYAHTHTSKADAEKVLAGVAKSSVGKVGKRSIKAQPVLTRIEGT